MFVNLQIQRRNENGAAAKHCHRPSQLRGLNSRCLETRRVSEGKAGLAPSLATASGFDFGRNTDRARFQERRAGRPRRAGVSLYEVIIALAVIGVLMASSAPSFSRSIEQSHADVAGANLRAIWSAQRLYWLEHRTFAADLPTLESLGLVDPAIISGGSRYSYAIASSDDETFAATATRIGSGRWSGQFSVDETGIVSGNIAASGVSDISPGFVD